MGGELPGHPSLEFRENPGLESQCGGHPHPGEHSASRDQLFCDIPSSCGRPLLLVVSHFFPMLKNCLSSSEALLALYNLLPPTFPPPLHTLCALLTVGPPSLFQALHCLASSTPARTQLPQPCTPFLSFFTRRNAAHPSPPTLNALSPVTPVAPHHAEEALPPHGSHLTCTFCGVRPEMNLHYSTLP